MTLIPFRLRSLSPCCLQLSRRRIPALHKACHSADAMARPVTASERSAISTSLDGVGLLLHFRTGSQTLFRQPSVMKLAHIYSQVRDMVTSADMICLKTERDRPFSADVPVAESGEEQFWPCARSFFTSHTGVQVLDLQIARVFPLKDCGGISKNLLAADAHAAPLGLELLGAQLSSKQFAAICEKFR